MYAIELSSCKHKYYTEPILEQTFSECCYSRLYQSRPPTTASGLIGSSALANPAGQSNDYPLSTGDQEDKGSAGLSAAQLTSQLAHLTADRENLATDNLISTGLPNNANGFSGSSSNAARLLSSILSSPSRQTMQHLNHMVPNNAQANNRPAMQSNSLDRSDRPIAERSPVQSTVEIFQQLQLNVDIEKLYLSKAKLLLTLRRNETMIANLSDDERSLLLKALDTSKLDYTIKRLTGLLQSNGATAISGDPSLHSFTTNSLTAQSSASHPASNLPPSSQPASGLQTSSNRQADLQAASNQLQSNGTQNDLVDEAANRPLAAPSNGSSLIDQLQLLLAANKWVANGSVDHYANLPAADEESGLLDDDLDTVNPIEADL